MATTSRAGQAATIGLAALVGILTLYFAVPRTVAAALLLPGDGPLRALQNGRAPAPGAVEAIVGSRTAAAHWVDDGRLWTDRALARLVEAELTAAKDKQPPDPAKLEEISRDLATGLALEPVNPHGWARLAYLRFLQKKQLEVASALRLSFLTGPYEADMTFPRLRLALAVWSNFTTEERELARRQIRFGWLLSRDEVVELAILSRRTLVFRLALVNQPQDLAIFDSMFKERGS
jgi:hypothetical protein